MWLSFSALLFSCNFSRTIQSNEEIPVGSAPSSPARLIAAKGTILQLGSDDPQAAPEERPGWTRFQHDFWMDTTEVTQKEFSALVGRNPSAVKGEALPVTNVTWFDAVLAANARSKHDGLDTVYQYSSSTLGTDGMALELAGLSIHLDRNGWRLPTEAEWELAARAGSTSPFAWGSIADSAKARRFAWLQANASGTIQPIGTLEANAWGLHDMAGNVMEWVQDWKGSFPKDTIDDFAGQASPGEVADIPVKGGACKFGIAFLRPSNRSATYASGRSARTEYVGFRLARGGFRPSFIDPSGASFQIPPVNLVASDLSARISVQAARLVFLNRTNGKGTLSWVDFGEASPIVRYLPDSLPVFHPVISPDGKWVAWSTALEGSVSPSRIRARRLSTAPSAAIDLGAGAIPRWWVNGTDTFLIRAEAMDNLSSSWPSSRTTMRRWSAGALESSEQLLTSGSFHDGRSRHFLYSGYRRLKQRDLISGKDRILFTAPENGKTTGDTSQVCNVSTSPDGSGRVMFLDFGFGGRSGVVGRPYGIHEVAFVADSNGRILQNLPAPAGEQQWDHLEWTNNSRWAVASVQSGTGANHAIHLLDLETGSSLQLATGEDLWQPGLWVSDRVGSQAVSGYDSAGRYFDPIQTPEMTVFGENLLRFWLLSDSLDVVLVGSSHLAGFLPAHFPNHHALSLAMPASTLSDWEKISRLIVLPHAPKLRTLVVSFMPGWFFRYNGIWPGERWSPVIRQTSGIRFDTAHGFWSSGIPAGFKDRVRLRLSERSLSLDPVPIGVSGPGWGAANLDINPLASEDTLDPEFSANLAIMDGIIARVTQRGIHVLVVNNPQSPGYANSPFAGRYGPTWPAYHALIQRFRAREKANPFFHFYDAHLDGHHDYADQEAGNWDHLIGKGYMKLGFRIDSIVSSFR
ncbi:MAG: SUMF1/EgtB/PvdO family nonheme iron enzyme [Fibrobacterota bacterium]|nr:MAG: SUMF1/EgtB/PvdO family nonheme iron enzyme [Fibrobacterota bacterium]